MLDSGAPLRIGSSIRNLFRVLVAFLIFLALVDAQPPPNQQSWPPASVPSSEQFLEIRAANVSALEEAILAITTNTDELVVRIVLDWHDGTLQSTMRFDNRTMASEVSDVCAVYCTLAQVSALVATTFRLTTGRHHRHRQHIDPLTFGWFPGTEPRKWRTSSALGRHRPCRQCECGGWGVEHEPLQDCG